MKAWNDLNARIAAEFRECVSDSDSVLKARQKFSELDTQTQSYVLIGSFAVFMLVLVLTFFTLWGRTISLKTDLARIQREIAPDRIDRAVDHGRVETEQETAQCRGSRDQYHPQRGVLAQPICRAR